MNEEFNPETQEENVYSEEGREKYVEGDEISSQEEAFMKGYDEADETDDAEEKDKEKDEEKDEEKDVEKDVEKETL